MSKKHSNVSIGSCVLTEHWKIGFLEGRILTLIETLGLPDKQESSLKNLVSNEIWSALNGNDVRAVPEKIVQEIMSFKDNLIPQTPAITR